MLSNSLDQGNMGQITKFVVGRIETDQSQPLPTRLVDDIEILGPEQAVVTRHFAFGKNDSAAIWTINDQPFNPHRAQRAREAQSWLGWSRGTARLYWRRGSAER